MTYYISYYKIRNVLKKWRFGNWIQNLYSTEKIFIKI